MFSRTIARAREFEGETHIQWYDYTIQDSFIKYRRNNTYNNFLREQFLRFPEKELFLDSSVPSASSMKNCLPVDKDGKIIYKLRKEHDVLDYIEVKHYPDCSHILSQVCLESQGYVDKKAAKEMFGNDYISDKWNQHRDVQRHFMNSGFADATELPLGFYGIGTAFVDIVYTYKNEIWFCDYKPEANSAKNKFAVSQIQFQINLFKLMTGLEARGAYFDEKDTYILI